MDRSKFFAVIGMVAALFSLTLNCSGGLVPVDIDGSSSSPSGNLPGVSADLSLQCDPKDAVESGPLAAEGELIKAAGRIYSDRDSGGFLDDQGNLFFVREDAAAQMDIGTKYKWFSFPVNDWAPGKYFSQLGKTLCGVTTDDKVKCFNNTTSTWAEITELEGSVQVAGFSRNLCGLKSDGKVQCLNEYMTPNLLPLDQPVKLLTAEWIVTTDGKEYRAEDALNQTPTSPYYHNNVLSSGSNLFLDLKELSLCGAKFKNYSYGDGYLNAAYMCGVSERGRLYCTFHPMKYAAIPETVMIGVGGKYTSQFTSVDNVNRYLAVRIFSRGLMCGIRSDLKVSCFNPGFGYADLNAARTLGLTIQTKTVAKFPNPASVTNVITVHKRACGLSRGKIECFDNPIIDPLTGVEKPMYVLDPNVSYTKIFTGYFRNGGYIRVCGQTEQGQIKCQVTTLIKPGFYEDKNEMEVVEEGTFYNDVTLSGQAESCGWTKSNRWDPLESTCRHASLSIL